MKALAVLKNYLEVLKPRETILLGFVGMCTVIIASGGNPPVSTFLLATATILIASGGANGITNYLDRKVDARMARTCGRPLVTGMLGVGESVVFAALLGVAGFVILYALVNPLTNGAPITGLAATKKSTIPTPGTGKEYLVSKGDTLFKIARANGVTVSALTRANPKLKNSALKSGQKIQIPAPAATAAAGIGFAEPGTGASANSGNVHVVKAGETLTQIAKQHGTTVKALQAANQMKVTRLLVGQKVKLPAATPHSTPTSTAPAGVETKVSDASAALKP